jgi:hypothetical protein
MNSMKWRDGNEIETSDEVSHFVPKFQLLDPLVWHLSSSQSQQQMLPSDTSRTFGRTQSSFDFDCMETSSSLPGFGTWWHPWQFFAGFSRGGGSHIRLLKQMTQSIYRELEKFGKLTVSAEGFAGCCATERSIKLFRAKFRSRPILFKLAKKCLQSISASHLRIQRENCWSEAKKITVHVSWNGNNGKEKNQLTVQLLAFLQCCFGFRESG